MNYIISASTDIGIRKNINQDSFAAWLLNTNQGRMVFAVLCDGMGGLAHGEVASATLIYAFKEWMNNELPGLSVKKLSENTIRNNWNNVIKIYNRRIMDYGISNKSGVGTTVVAMLLTDTRYYIMNVGDSRAYEILNNNIHQITQDQTVVAEEIRNGMLTPKQAETDPRRNVLLQCVGATNNVIPEYFFGETMENAVYLLCSDGFRHKISTQEIYSAFEPKNMISQEIIKNRELEMIDINKQRREEDNITVLTIKTFIRN
jgi:serine/threonine protein phosphatase PrpC